ncbi:Lrp/AsnC family transcriptional regulator [Ottowia flava]|uniref:Lrp/AsnC family transcriptional regulator n=2 Tax=Comamonadaceae TaxID=80864 RepID=A0ABW4KTA0_9BURK
MARKVWSNIACFSNNIAAQTMLDRIDRKLLNLLQNDASRTNAALAQEVGLSPSSCLRRVQRLLRDGFVDRIVAVLSPSRLGRGLKAVVLVELAEHGEQEQRRFLELAVIEPAVAQAYAVTGRTDVVLTLRLKDMEEFDALCNRLFRQNVGVKRFFTMMVIRTAKEATIIPL